MYVAQTFLFHPSITETVISIQSGNPYNATEYNPELELVIATLSTGPVGFSDAINATNITLVKSSCRSDGYLLQPDRYKRLSHSGKDIPANYVCVCVSVRRDNQNDV